jgi:Ca2+-binding EF-hand superfamily protein
MSKQEIETILNDESKLNEIVKAAFESVDTDGSGYIEEAELKVVMTSVARDINMTEPSQEDVSKVLIELDSNRDGKVSQEEFKVLIRQVLELMLTTLN